MCLLAPNIKLRIGIIFTKFELGQPVYFWLLTLFTADTLRHT